LLLLAILVITGCDTETRSSSTPIQAPTKVVQSSPKVILTPSPTPSLQQRYYELLKDVVANSKVTYDISTNWLNVSYPAEESLTNDLTITLIKERALQVMKAVYTSKLGGVQAIILHSIGDTVDKYGHQSNDDWSKVTLNKDTAMKFAWDTITQDQAWDDYDNTWLINGLS
jgi:hypothetical protein